MPRVLLLATTTGYQTRAFADASERLGVELVFATDRCNVLDDPWQDHAVPVRFHLEETSAAAILEAAHARPIDGVLAVGDRPTVIAALAAEALGIPGHPPGACAVARNKLLTRERLRAAGLPVPWFVQEPIETDPHALASRVSFPCVIKPLVLSGSRGVMRVDTEQELVAAMYRLRSLLQSADIRAERDAAHDAFLVEGFIEGHEFALEGLMNEGELHTLAVFDKPDPLDGPFFEETIYVTPTPAGERARPHIAGAVARAAKGIGLYHGPIHAECRVGASGVFVLEVAARPIGGLCARALRFASSKGGPLISLEELLLRHALGEPSWAWQREADASGVMMIPIPRRGIFRRAGGLEEARAVPLVEDVRITAKPDQALIPLPEGASYLGFIFARGASSDAVVRALGEAHGRLVFTIDPEVRVLQSAHV